jgi:hypothetical protein
MAPGGVNADSMAAVAESARADARLIAPVAAVKANVLNMPLLAVMTFTAAISCLFRFRQIGSRLVQNH